MYTCMHARVCAYIHDVNKCKRWDLRIIFRVWGGCAVLSHHKEGFAAQSGLVGALALRVAIGLLTINTAGPPPYDAARHCSAVRAMHNAVIEPNEAKPRKLRVVPAWSLDLVPWLPKLSQSVPLHPHPRWHCTVPYPLRFPCKSPLT
jgi:hypothetical protein